MTRRSSESVVNSFIGGLKTEFTGLNFPENAVTDCDNVVFDGTGNAYRRGGFDFEDGKVFASINRLNAAVNTYHWKNVGGLGTTQMLVKQVGDFLHFYETSAVTATAPISQRKSVYTVYMRPFAPQGGVGPASFVNECQFSEGNGYLFVFHPNLEPFYVSYYNGIIIAHQITVQIRDQVGLPEIGVPNNYRPATADLTARHLYNLQNQGWASGPTWTASSTSTLAYTAVAFGNGTGAQVSTGNQTFTVAAGLAIVAGNKVKVNGAVVYTNGFSNVGTLGGEVVSYAGTTLVVNITSVNMPPVYPDFVIATSSWQLSAADAGGLLGTWNTALSNYPSNADQWWRFKDSTGIFDPATTADNVTLDNSPAPKGLYILYAFSQTRSAFSGIANITDIATFARPKTGAWFQGRVWYAGADDSIYSGGEFYSWTEKIYYSQTIEDPSQFGLAYRANDPTSEITFDALPTDGGFLDIQGCGSIHKLFPIQNGLLVFADNGIWFVTGSQGIGFSATDHTVTRISSVQSISGTSFVDVEGYPIFWNREGIYAVAPGENGQLQVQSLSKDTIASFYEEIPVSSKLFARGAYNPIEKRIVWLFRSTEPTTVTERYEFNRMLNFDVETKAFYPYTVAGGPKIHAVNYIYYPGTVGQPEPTFKYTVSVPQGIIVDGNPAHTWWWGTFFPTSGTVGSFRVGKNNRDQVYIHSGAFENITWPTVYNDSTGGFEVENSLWRAPSAGTLVTASQVWDRDGAALTQGTNSFIAQLRHNGLTTTTFHGFGDIGSFPNSTAPMVSGKFDVNAGDYVEVLNFVTPAVGDASLYDFTFAEEHDFDTYRDWASYDTGDLDVTIVGENYESYFISGYRIAGAAQRKFQPTYVYMYSNNDENTSYKIQGIWNYANSGNSGKFSSVQLITNDITNFDKVYRRHKIRGHGTVLQFKISSVDGEPFDIMGWSIWETQNASV